MKTQLVVPFVCSPAVNSPPAHGLLRTDSVSCKDRASTCEKFLLQKEPLEQFVEGLVAEKVRSLDRGEGIDLLEKNVAGGEASRSRARREAARLRACVVQIENKAGMLLEGLTEDTRDFVNSKLRELATEKGRLQRQLQELESN